jgi:hypothetical protein
LFFAVVIGTMPLLMIVGAISGVVRYLTSAKPAAGSFAPAAITAEKLWIACIAGGIGLCEFIPRLPNLAAAFFARSLPPRNLF